MPVNRDAAGRLRETGAIERVMILNRGEIAIRIARTLRRLGIASYGIHSEEDRGARHTRELDHCDLVSGSGEASPYLNVAAILEIAARNEIDAVHPGYGYLSENDQAAREFEEAGLTWIGPGPEAIALLGDKARSKELAVRAGVPVVPGVPEEGLTPAAVAELGERVGYPIVLKASGGGGGKGMRRVDRADQIEEAIAAAARESVAAFGSDRLLAEKLVEPARHVEVQVAIDQAGQAVALGERECSLQRRYQKLVEESPSPAVDETRRERLERAALDLAREAGYRNLGTVEFLLDAGDPDQFYFLEMNARLQVEHPVTELVTGLDLVEMQVAIAEGRSISEFETSRRTGHAIEARICAERPADGFLPATGTVLSYEEPKGVRCDSGIGVGSRVTTDFDPMLMKVIAHGDDRDQAIGRLETALAELTILGVETNADYLRWLVDHPQVRDGATTTGLVEGPSLDPPVPDRDRALAAVGAVLACRERTSGIGFDDLDSWRITGSGTSHWNVGSDDGVPVHLAVTGSDSFTVSIDGDELARGPVARVGADAIRYAGTTWRFAFEGQVLWLSGPDGVFRFDTDPPLARTGGAADDLVAPLPGSVLSVEVREGQRVEEGDALIVIESMKMEITISAPEAGVVDELSVAPGDHVERGRKLAVISGGEA